MRLGRWPQVAPEKVELVGNDGVVFGAVVNVEVADTGVGANLALGRPLAAAIAGSGSATLSSSATHTSQGQCSVSAWRIGL